MKHILVPLLVLVFTAVHASSAQAALSLTAGANATTTPNVATSIPGFQIIGPAASTTPVKLRATNGTLNLSAVSGVSMSGNGSGTVNLTGAVSNLNAALSTLTYSRANTGTDTLEVSLVEAGEVFFEGTGHLYKYISDAGDWNAAKTKAEALTLYGAAGYLATITSPDENSFVTARLSNAGWMGGSDSAVEEVWRWVTGPEAGLQFWTGGIGGSAFGGNYANWNTGEPNDSGSNEDCSQYLSGGSGKWNDLPCSGSPLPGYVAEFGAPSNLPTVVAQNISIVTADVPALTSLSPANGSASALPNAALVIGFSKAVSTSTGTITVRKSSDDSIVQSIDVAGAAVTGGGTSSITITLPSALEEGVQYYVLIPATAFRDASSNFFSGITGKTTWSFTTADVTAPLITNVAAAPATTTASVTWTTNEAASTKVVYGVGTGYAQATSESDTGPRVTSHTKALSSLSACTTYSFKVVSGDAAGNRATSTPGVFTTLGCVGGEPSAATTTTVSANATSTAALTESGRTITVTTPANVTATSSSVVIQIQAKDSLPVVSALGMPDGFSDTASVAFDVTALVNGTTVLDSFDRPVTVSYAYTDEDIAGLDEGSLAMYHYHANAWVRLTDCVHDQAANTLSCTTPNFSVFAIFGTPPSSGSGSSGSRSGGSISSRVKNLTDMGKVAEADALKAQWPSLFPAGTAAGATSSSAPAVRDLETGMTGDDVRMLQALLNASGFPLAASGVGSAGNETTYFGALTRAAVSAYQAAHGVVPSAGYFGPLTRAAMKAKGLAGIWW